MALNARTLLLICLTSAGWEFCLGLGSQVVSRWLHAQTISDTVIGLNHSFYYFGAAVGSCAVPMMTRRLGPVWCAGLGMIFSGISLAIYPWGEGETEWYLLRFVNGWASAMALVPLEALISRASAPERKTRNFACYGVALALGAALGVQRAPYFYDLGGDLAFQRGGCAPALAGLILLAALHGRLRPVEEPNIKTPLGWGRNFLSYGTAWAQGFLEGGMLAFLVLFLSARGFSNGEAETLMSVTIVGVILFQVPVSWLADRYGKTPLLLACYGVVLGGLVAIPWLSNSIALAACLFCFGACSGAMYPLGMAMLSDRMPESGLARAYAWYLAVECVGSQAGAAAMGKARDLWGETSMFTIGFVAVAGVVAAWLVLPSQTQKASAADQRNAA